MPEPSIALLPPPSPETVRKQLQAILASRPFVTATRARRFLTHIVEQTLAGRTDGIKELCQQMKQAGTLAGERGSGSAAR